MSVGFSEENKFGLNQLILDYCFYPLKQLVKLPKLRKASRCIGTKLKFLLLKLLKTKRLFYLTRRSRNETRKLRKVAAELL